MTGKYDHNLDGKGRLILPSKLRPELGETFYMAPGYYEGPNGELEANLTLYPMAVWNRICQQLAEMPASESNQADVFFSTAERCEPDSQNRILIPVGLRIYAGLKKAVVVVGCNDRAKIWDAALWERTNGATLTASNIAAMMKRLKL